MDDMSATFLPLDELRRRRSVKWRTYDPDVLPLWVAEMDVALAPPIAAALRAAVARGDTGYVHAGDLAETYAAFSARRYGWAPAPARTSLVPDVMHGIAAVLRLATEPGDHVVINPPVYPPFWHFVHLADRDVREVGLHAGADGYTLDLAGLERAFAEGAAAYLLCNPHNPTGSVWDRDALLAVADLAERHDVLVLADEVHAPLTHDGIVHVPFGALDHPAAQRAVTFVAASKAWNLPGLKAALTLAGPDAPPALTTLPHEVQVGTGLFGVLAARAAFAHGEQWLSSLRTRLDDNRRLLADLLARHLPAIDHRPPDATYLAWLDCRALGLGDDPAAVFLERGRVALNSGHTFGAQGRGFVRLNLATSPELLDDAVRRMVIALDN
ncbi:MAG TPA: aminotransferase class I/II-fold pyridoxal phosphate-dependent enzyme [Euzebyales bacterium]